MIEDTLVQIIYRALKSLYNLDEDQTKITIQKTRKEFEGDYTYVVFPILKYSKKTPEETANEIGEYLVKSTDEITSFNVIKGFLNITIYSDFWFDFLTEEYNNQDFGFKAPEKYPPHVIEYSSPNTNKPLHLGHIRNNLMGYAVSNILKANGYPTVKVNLVNDI